MIARRLACGDIAATGGWNIGPDPSAAISVLEVARRLAAEWPAIEYTVAEEETGVYEAPTLVLDCNHIRHQLGWEPKTGLDEALAMTAAWYRSVHSSPNDAAAITTKQIRAYMDAEVTREKVAG